MLEINIQLKIENMIKELNELKTTQCKEFSHYKKLEEIEKEISTLKKKWK
jgi:predicted DNA binding CopG/RHH family protein